MQILKFLIIFLYSLPVFSDTVRFNDLDNLTIMAHTSSNFALTSEAPDDESTTIEKPLVVYAPVTNSNGSAHDKFHSEYNSSKVTTMINSSESSHYISFPLITSFSTRPYLYAASAIENSSTSSTDFKLVAKSVDPDNGTAINFNLSLNALCTYFATECSNLGILNTSSLSTSKATFKIYFFMSSNPNLILGDIVNVADDSIKDGVYSKTIFSNKINNATTNIVKINSSKIGDGRVILEYETSSPITDFDQIVIYKHSTANPSVENVAVGEYTGTLLDRNFEDRKQTDKVIVNDLNNNEAVTLSIGLMDKFGFITPLSKAVTLIPINIDQLIKKTSCFLLTAGFGEEHYIINYFRNFRDQKLQNFKLGRVFIKYYYRLAPKYALLIYQNPAIRLIIRGLAYTFYFFFHYFLLNLLLIIVLILSYFKIKKRQHYAN